MPAKVCMLLHEFYPNDIRVSKEAKALLSEGFEIHLICLKRKDEPESAVVEGIQVHRIAMAQTFFWRGIWDIVLAFNFFQSRFFKKAAQLHQQLSFDVVHVHDLPLSKTALRLRKRFPDLKVVLDLHENYPEALRVWYQWKKNPLIRLKNRIFFGFDRWLRYEKSVVKQADLVIVVVDEMKERVAELHQLDKSRICVVTNSESLDFMDQEKIPDIYERDSDTFLLAYTGGVGPHRGVDAAIKALAYLKHRPGVRLEITGSLSKASRDWLEGLIAQEEVGDQVRINGYQPFHRFFSYMYYADVNLIPHNRNGHTDNTVPHKLYQGMMVGKPVLVSDAPPLKRIVNELDSGLVFKGGDPKDLAAQIDKLIEQPELAKRLGVNGSHKTLKDIHNWEHTGKGLAQRYQQLLAKDPQRP